jgi:hypothetical protein
VHEQESGDLYLVYAEGRHYGDAPFKMKQYSANSNPGHDSQLVRDLPALLARLREQ